MYNSTYKIIFSFIAIFSIFLIQNLAYAELDKAGFKPISDKSQICMVNDRYMGSVQIPVEVSGKTYYGCCEGCVGKLKRNESLRKGKDPLSGKEVDKTVAFAAADKSNSVLYFESEESFKKYTEEK